jgi:hypothetical protein
MGELEVWRKWRSLVLKVDKEEVTMSFGSEFHLRVLRAINEWEERVLWRIC